MKVIFLAAGYGKRLGKFTETTPKCLLDVNGKSILERDIDAFLQNGIDDLIIITGPNSQKFKFMNVEYIHDLNYKKHDVLGTLMEGKEFLNDEIIISYTDIIYDSSIVKSIMNFTGDIGLAVDMDWEKAYVGRTDHPISEAANVMIKNETIVKIGHQNARFGKHTDDMIGEFLGIMKLSKKGARILLDKYEELEKTHVGKYYERSSFKFAYIVDILQDLIDHQISVNPIKISGNWCEIDTVQDLENSKKIFNKI